ncbi:hypothetical protein BDR05DRAFT_955276 [Suillus weaverae]|nr:hypothetical protein BDR05DRAFT_955276 [Suillus weaverae]
MGADDSKHDNQFTAEAYALHPSGATDARRRSAWTSALDTILDFGPNTEGNVKESKRSRGVNFSRSEDGLCPWSAKQHSTAASSLEIDNPRADGISRVVNSVESNVSRQMEMLKDEDPEEGDQGDQDIPFSSKLVLDASKHYCSPQTLATLPRRRSRREQSAPFI